MAKQVFLYSVLYGFHSFLNFWWFVCFLGFLLINTHQPCSKTSVIIKYIIFTLRFSLDLCELSLNFFILTDPLPQDLCILISQDKNPRVIQQWRDIMSDSRLTWFLFSLQLLLPAGCRGTDHLLQWPPLCPAPRLCVLPPGQPWDASQTKQRGYWKMYPKHLPVTV